MFIIFFPRTNLSHFTRQCSRQSRRGSGSVRFPPLISPTVFNIKFTCFSATFALLLPIPTPNHQAITIVISFIAPLPFYFIREWFLLTFSRPSSLHPANADILGNYAQFLLGERGDHAAAESMFKRALAAREGHIINLVCGLMRATLFWFSFTFCRSHMRSFWQNIAMCLGPHLPSASRMLFFLC